jgi:hypothetical protein
MSALHLHTSLLGPDCQPCLDSYGQQCMHCACGMPCWKYSRAQHANCAHHSFTCMPVCVNKTTAPTAVDHMGREAQLLLTALDAQLSC